MKKFFTCLFICILCLVFYANYPRNISAQWDDPRYDRVPDNLTDYHSYFTYPPQVITIDDYDNFDLGIDFAEVHISMNPNNPLEYLAAWNNLSAALGVRTYGTKNGGLNWYSVPPTWGASMNGDPCTAHDSLGNTFVDNLFGSVAGTKVATSTDNGQSWSTVVPGNTGNDKNWIAADQTGGPYANNIYITITPGNFKRSTDHGATFVQTTTLTPQNLPGMMVCVGPNGAIQGGSVFVVTNSGNSFASTYTFFRSTDGGQTFSNMSSQNFSNYVGTNVGGRNSVSNMRTRPYPFITADNSYGPFRGRLYIFYASNTPAGNGNKPDIFTRFSTDGGTTWSSEVIVNDDASSENNNQWMPAPWCDKQTGKLYVQWLDTRDCPTSDSCFVYASYSTNGGASFVANQRVSNKKFRINCTSCNGGTPAYLGDYDAITSNSKTSMLAWTDFRNNTFANFTAYFPDYGMRVNPTNITINNGNSATFRVVIPSVKLYTDTTTFTATVTPPPTAGALTVSFPGGNTLHAYPDSLLARVSAAPSTTSGSYTVTVQAAGSNGTPVHIRTLILTVGLVGITGITEVPDKYELSQNYPNPFNPSTKISYTLRNQTNVKLSVFDAMGRLVATINKGVQEPGSHFVNFNGSALSSGVYYYKLETQFFTDTKKMLLIK